MFQEPLTAARVRCPARTRLSPSRSWSRADTRPFLAQRTSGEKCPADCQLRSECSHQRRQQPVRSTGFECQLATRTRSVSLPLTAWHLVQLTIPCRTAPRIDLGDLNFAPSSSGASSPPSSCCRLQLRAPAYPRVISCFLLPTTATWTCCHFVLFCDTTHGLPLAC
jgi:hypothetical protein